MKAATFLGLAAILVGVTGCQTTSLSTSDTKGKSTSLTKSNFELRTDTTFRPLDDLTNRGKQNDAICSLELAAEEIDTLSYFSNNDLQEQFRSAGGGTSLTRTHDLFSNVWIKLNRASIIARAHDNSEIAHLAINELKRFADANVLLETIGARAANQMKCWKSSGSSCPFHNAQTAAEFFANSTHAAINLRKWLNEVSSKKKVIDDWLAQGFAKYVKGAADVQGTGPNGGLYEYMNQHIGVLFYAIYRNDPELFLSYAERGISQISRLLNKEGYIFNNSYRGSRAVWYHSLGVDGILGFGELLEAQGVQFFDRPDLKDRLLKSYANALRGASDWKWFESKGTKGKNFITDDARSRRHLHQLASSIQYIGGWRYPEIGVLSLRTNFDKVIGADPLCIYGDRTGKLKETKYKEPTS